MKVLFYIHSLSAGGAERVTATLANHWAGKDWKVVIVTVAAQDQDFYKLDSRIERIALDMAIQSRHAGQAVLHNLRRILSLRRIFRREKPDVAIAMMATANVTLALVGRMTGVSTVGSERTYPPALPLGSMWESARRRVYPLLCGLVAQTRDSAVWLEKHAPAKHIKVIPNPVNYPLEVHEPQISPGDMIGVSADGRILLAVGRLGEEKRFDRLLDAYARVCQRHADWSLVILGQGSLRDSLLKQADELGIRDRVAMPGAVGNIGEWFEAADLCVLTSRFEGFPNVLLEALAHGVPAVAVDCETGPREIVRHEVDGLLVPQDDLEALAKALDRLMNDSELRRRFGERAVEARERFAVKQIAEQWEKFLRMLSERKAKVK